MCWYKRLGGVVITRVFTALALSLHPFWWRRRCHYKRFDGVITSISVALSLHADCWHCHYKRIGGIVLTNVMVALPLQMSWWRCHYKRREGFLVVKLCKHKRLDDVVITNVSVACKRLGGIVSAIVFGEF